MWGKTWTALAICKAVTNGETILGAQHTTPQNVLYFTTENHLKKVLRARLDKVGINTGKFFASDFAFSLNEDGLTGLESTIASQESVPALIVIDPLIAYLDVDPNRANKIRPVFTELGRIAHTHNCAFLLLRHLTKGSKDKALYRGLFSVDISAACRSVMMVATHPDRPNKRAVFQVKNNLTQKGSPI